MHRHTVSADVTPIYEVGPYEQAAPKTRKMSTGGNRSWSEEEEQYLLRTRAQKMPYKHIAAHLKKTELACRLHYHQLSHGSHRRRRSGSVSSTVSTNSTRTTPSRFSSYEPDEYAASESSRQMSPISSVGGSPRSRASGLHSSRASISFPTSATRTQKPLLPKPLHQTPYKRASTEEPPLTALRVYPSQKGPRSLHEVPEEPSSVDTGRLRSIYEAHRAKFWASVANEYGTNVSAAELEHVWKQGGSGTPSLANFPQGARPPTPDSGPETSKPTLPKLSTTGVPRPSYSRMGSFSSSVAPASSVSAAPINWQYPAYSQPASTIESAAPYGGFSAMSASVADSPRGQLPLPPLREAKPSSAPLERSASNMSRTTSAGSNGTPPTKIAALLTEDREPRGETESPGRAGREVAMRDA